MFCKVKYRFYLSVRFLDVKDIKIRFPYDLMFRSSTTYINTKLKHLYGTFLCHLNLINEALEVIIMQVVLLLHPEVDLILVREYIF